MLQEFFVFFGQQLRESVVFSLLLDNNNRDGGSHSYITKVTPEKH